MKSMRAIYAISLVAVVYSVEPGRASDFSAQDILTYCLANHADPAFVRDKLRSRGWENISPEMNAGVATKLAVGLIALDHSSQRGSFSPLDWAKSWDWAQKYADWQISNLDENRSVILIEPDSLSVIKIDWTNKTAIDIDCVLVVTEAATKSQSYHPRIPPASGYDAFYWQLERDNFSVSRAHSGAVLVSVTHAVVEAALGIKTDVAAVFQTDNSYPASAVRP